MTTKYYLKAMGSVCYNITGITYPNLISTQVYEVTDDRNGIHLFKFLVRRGQFDIERVMHEFGARGVRWARRWSNQPYVIVFDKLVDAGGNEVNEVCDEAEEFLFDMGLIIRPISDWSKEIEYA